MVLFTYRMDKKSRKGKLFLFLFHLCQNPHTHNAVWWSQLTILLAKIKFALIHRRRRDCQGLWVESPMVRDKHATDKVQKCQHILQLYLTHYHFLYIFFRSVKKKSPKPNKRCFTNIFGCITAQKKPYISLRHYFLKEKWNFHWNSSNCFCIYLHCIYFYIFVARSINHEKLPPLIFNYRRISGSYFGKIKNVQLLQDNPVAYEPLLEACVVSSRPLMYPNSFSWENVELPFISPTSQEKHSTPIKRD